MSQRREPLPIASMMPVLVGLGILIVFWRFKHVVDTWQRFPRLLFLFAGLLLFSWGLYQILLVLSGRKIPSKGRLSRHKAMLPREGMAYLLIMGFMFVGSLIGRSNMLMLVFATLAGPFVINGSVSYWMLRRIGVRRDLPERCMAGDVVSIQVEVENRRRMLSSWILSVRDTIANPEEQLETGAVFARVPARAKCRTSYQFRPLRRGRYQFGPVTAFTRFPFGLVERSFTMPSSGTMLVYPRIGRLTAKWKKQISSQADLLDRRQGRKGTFDDEFHRIREYRPGDNPRAIHWRSSAKHRELMVREYEECRDRELSVVLDLWLPEEPDVLDHVHTELAISFTATIALEQIRENTLTDFRLRAVGSETITWDAGDSTSEFEELLDEFAVMSGGSAEATADVLEDELSIGSPRKRVVVVTTRPPGKQQFLRDLETGNGAVGTATMANVQTVFADWDTLTDFFVLD